jgi:uncharacterized protein YdaU (DUF1376 family)
LSGSHDEIEVTQKRCGEKKRVQSELLAGATIEEVGSRVQRLENQEEMEFSTTATAELAAPDPLLILSPLELLSREMILRCAIEG